MMTLEVMLGLYKLVHGTAGGTAVLVDFKTGMKHISLADLKLLPWESPH